MKLLGYQPVNLCIYSSVKRFLNLELVTGTACVTTYEQTISRLERRELI